MRGMGGFQRGIVGEGLAGFFRLIDARLGGGKHPDAERRDQFADLRYFSGIVAGDDQRLRCQMRDGCISHPIAFACATASFLMPFRASFSNASNSFSLTGASSAVHWISTI